MFKPVDESLCIDSPMTLCINYLNQQSEHVRINELIDTEIQMINANISDEEQQLYHELTTYEPFNNPQMSGYKTLLQKITNPFQFC